MKDIKTNIFELNRKIIDRLVHEHYKNVLLNGSSRWLIHCSTPIKKRRGYVAPALLDDVLATNKKIDEMWAELYDPVPAKTTEKEISDEWAKHTTNEDLYEVGDDVMYKGKRFEIKRCYGRNAQGVREYEIRNSREWLYVDEDEICKVPEKSERVEAAKLPPVPSGCDHGGAYLNKMNTFEFWYCPECKEEVEDPSSQATQKELDDFFDWF